MNDQDTLRKFFDAGQNWGERKLQPWSNTEEFNIALRDFGGLLACTNCSKILPVGEMYSVDACSEKCQAKLAAQQSPAPAPLPVDPGEAAQMFTTHILARWNREFIEKFCLHLLGDAYQERETNVELLAGLVQLVLKYSWNFANATMRDEMARLAGELARKQ